MTQLLHKLAPADPRFAAAAMRFTGYLKQPPAFQLANAAVGSTRFWLSKPAHVDAQSPAGPTRSLSLNAGWHTVSWKLPALSGVYPVQSDRPRLRRQHRDDQRAADRARGRDLRDVGARRPRRAQLPPPVAQPRSWSARASTFPRRARSRRSSAWESCASAWPGPPAAPTPDPGLVQALQSVPAGLGIVVELIAARCPVDAAGQAALAAYAVSLAQQVPAIRDLVLAPAVTVATARAYVATLSVRAPGDPDRGAVGRDRRRARRLADAEGLSDGARPGGGRDGAADRARRPRLPSRTRGRDGRVDDRRSEEARDRARRRPSPPPRRC